MPDGAHRVEIAALEIPVGDPRRAAAWYSEHLGFNEEWADEHHAMLGLDHGPKLLLVRTDSEARFGFCGVTGLSRGGVSLHASDLAALHARLLAAGGRVDDFDVLGTGPSFRGFGCEDSEGNRLWVSASPSRPPVI